MKTQITRTMIALIFLAIATVTTANERAISLKSEDSKSVILQMENVDEGTSITIKNNKGDILFEDKAAGKRYIKNIPLERLEEGKLSLEVENAESLEILSVSVSQSNAMIRSGRSTLYVKPVVRMDDNQLRLFLRADHSGYYMKMTDRYGEIVYREEISKDDQGLKRYDVSRLPSGKYNLKFTTQGKSFYQTVVID